MWAACPTGARAHARTVRKQAKSIRRRNSTETCRGQAQFKKGNASKVPFGVEMVDGSVLFYDLAFSVFSKLCIISMHSFFNQKKKGGGPLK